jgi:hypothetical protein
MYVTSIAFFHGAAPLDGDRREPQGESGRSQQLGRGVRLGARRGFLRGHSPHKVEMRRASRDRAGLAKYRQGVVGG